MIVGGATVLRWRTLPLAAALRWRGPDFAEPSVQLCWHGPGEDPQALLAEAAPVALAAVVGAAGPAGSTQIPSIIDGGLI